MKRFLMICAALALALAVTMPPVAAAGADCLTMAAAFDEEGEPAAAAPAVIFNDGGTCTVITASSVHVSGAAAYGFITPDGLAEMIYEGDQNDELAKFTCDESLLSLPGVLEMAESVQLDEELAYYFMYSGEDGVDVMSDSASISAGQNGSYVLHLPDSVQEYNIQYPAIALTQAGKLAVIEGEQSWLRMADITGDSAAPPATTTPPTDGPDPSGPIVRPTPDPGPTPTDPISSDPISTELIIGIAVVAVVIVAVVIVVLKRPKPKPDQRSTDSAQPSGGTLPPPPVPPTTPPPPSDPPVAPPPPPPPPPVSVLYLCCEGGVQDGKRYPVSAADMLIGRSHSCNICYPDGTKGVSRQHCRLFWKNGTLYLMDLGSTYGTFLRGRGQIAPNVPVPVKAGDTFYLAEKRNAFVIRTGG